LGLLLQQGHIRCDALLPAIEKWGFYIGQGDNENQS